MPINLAIEVHGEKEIKDVLNFFFPNYPEKESLLRQIINSGKENPLIHIDKYKDKSNYRKYPSYSNKKWAINQQEEQYKIISYKKFLSDYKKISTSKYVRQLNFESFINEAVRQIDFGEEKDFKKIFKSRFPSLVIHNIDDDRVMYDLYDLGNIKGILFYTNYISFINNEHIINARTGEINSELVRFSKPYGIKWGFASANDGYNSGLPYAYK